MPVPNAFSQKAQAVSVLYLNHADELHFMGAPNGSGFNNGPGGPGKATTRGHPAH